MSVKQSLFWGTFILLLSNIYIKGLGFCYKVFLMRALGAEGMGLIEMTSPVFSFLLVLSGWGITLALSQKIAKAGGNHLASDSALLFSNAFIMLTCFGLAVSLLAYFAAPVIVAYFAPDQRLLPYFRAIVPAILIIAVASGFRGYFQGIRKVAVLGLSQGFEQTVRVAVGLMLLTQLSFSGIESKTTAAAYATVAGELAGFILLFAAYKKLRKTAGKRPVVFCPSTCFSLLSFGTPVTINRLVTSVVLMLQAALIPWALQQSGLNVRGATESYGRLVGVAMTLLNLPGIFTSALTVSLLPAVAESKLHGDVLKSRVDSSLQAAVIFTLPSMAALFIFAGEFCGKIFHSPLSAEPLKLLTCFGLFYFTAALFASILQGLGELKGLLFNNIVSGIIFVLVILLLVTRPGWGLLGAALAMGIYFVVYCLLNILLYQKTSGLTVAWGKILVKPLIALVGAWGGYCFLLQGLIDKVIAQGTSAFIFALIVFGALYLLILRLIGGFELDLKNRLRRR